MSTVDAACPSACSRASVDLGWFRRRQLITIGGVALAVAVFQLGASICDFSLAYALTSVPAALAWMLQNFMLTASSLGELGYVLEQTVSTVLDSVAATVIAAILGIVLAVLGSRTVGAGSRCHSRLCKRGAQRPHGRMGAASPPLVQAKRVYWVFGSVPYHVWPAYALLFRYI